ncbi:MAG: alpha/beta hydrolase [Pseudomonadota bacterium]
MSGLFQGFDETLVDVDGHAILARVGGAGPPLLLVHGYPQSSAMWHRVAPQLAQQYRVIAPDLPGYGRSDASRADVARYAKRRLGRDMVALMAQLGHGRFAVCGHDRGGRVAYRMALDHPATVAALCVVDIVPTGAIWSELNARQAMAMYHWMFLAQPAPLPERLIDADPNGYMRHTLASWTGTGDLTAFDEAALAEYLKAYADPARVHAACQDYRAGATIDYDDDAETRRQGATIIAPTLLVHGRGIATSGKRTPLEIWREFAPNVEGKALSCGHFVAEEDPEGLLGALVPFLERHVLR